MKANKTVVLDTNALILFFSQKRRLQAQKVKKLIENKSVQCLIPDVVLTELEYILRRKYHRGRRDLKKVYQLFIDLPNLQLSKEAERAVSVYSKTKISMADCLIMAVAMERKCAVASFDKKLVELMGKKVYF